MKTVSTATYTDLHGSPYHFRGLLPDRYGTELARR